MNAFASGWNENNSIIALTTTLIENLREDELKAAVLRDKVTDYLVDNCIQVEQSDESE